MAVLIPRSNISIIIIFITITTITCTVENNNNCNNNNCGNDDNIIYFFLPYLLSFSRVVVVHGQVEFVDYILNRQLPMIKGGLLYPTPMFVGVGYRKPPLIMGSCLFYV